MEITDILTRSQILVKELAEGLNLGGCTFEQVEERILKFPHELGQGLEQDIVQGLQEPTIENSVRVGERTAVYAGKRNLRFLNRFGGEMVLPRRCYKFRDGRGEWTPPRSVKGTPQLRREMRSQGRLADPALPVRDRDLPHGAFST